ncbi:transposase [Citrobacter rodentium NBRC 105723 = DSM 16636]|uniref:Transposase IS116/IS110/IS902 C-terminal domain-containing protein n=1 Tax=Citrobacter rodentium TaxID=67825 RepID=A0A482PUW1_CITRO|nr:hypothetical protein E2R62_23995 [Citrobacter rodentium]UHO31066.1 transposase [Citrobacter rodentium NBRC 105723 = DSM 16636]
MALQNETCKRLMEIPGIGPRIATEAVAAMVEVSAFKSGRRIRSGAKINWF